MSAVVTAHGMDDRRDGIDIWLSALEGEEFRSQQLRNVRCLN